MIVDTPEGCTPGKPGQPHVQAWLLVCNSSAGKAIGAVPKMGARRCAQRARSPGRARFLLPFRAWEAHPDSGRETVEKAATCPVGGSVEDRGLRPESDPAPRLPYRRLPAAAPEPGGRAGVGGGLRVEPARHVIETGGTREREASTSGM